MCLQVRTLCAEVPWGPSPDGWETSGPARAGGSGQSPAQASETLDFPLRAGPTSKPSSEGRGLEINGRLKKARSPQATGRGSRRATTEEALTQPSQQPSWGARDEKGTQAPGTWARGTGGGWGFLSQGPITTLWPVSPVHT